MVTSIVTCTNHIINVFTIIFMFSCWSMFHGRIVRFYLSFYLDKFGNHISVFTIELNRFPWKKSHLTPTHLFWPWWPCFRFLRFCTTVSPFLLSVSQPRIYKFFIFLTFVFAIIYSLLIIVCCFISFNLFLILIYLLFFLVIKYQMPLPMKKVSCHSFFY